MRSKLSHDVRNCWVDRHANYVPPYFADVEKPTGRESIPAVRGLNSDLPDFCHVPGSGEWDGALLANIEQAY